MSGRETVPDEANYSFVLSDEGIEIQELSTGRNQTKSECQGQKKKKIKMRQARLKKFCKCNAHLIVVIVAIQSHKGFWACEKPSDRLFKVTF